MDTADADAFVNGSLPVKRIEFSPASARKETPAATKVEIQKELIQVYLRLRPTKNSPCLEVLGDSAVALKPPSDSLFVHSGYDATTADKYFFNGVFGDQASQEEVYEKAAVPLVQKLLDGENCLLFSYGPTNAGKTYTIQGDGADREGVLPRALRDVLNAMEQNTDDNVNLALWATYLEIYNEQVYDLLGEPATTATGRASLKIKEEHGNVVVKGLKEVQVRSLSDAISVLQYGQTNRQVAETVVNQDSSRSHSIFNIRLERRDAEGTELGSSKLSIVDLAGCERSSRTQNTGLRLREASNINVSLMNLGRCLEALRWNQQHPGAHPHMVPFRQSKLTRIFQDWFTIHSSMVMLVNVSPEPRDFDEMLQALRYGAVAREIQIVRKVNSFKMQQAVRGATSTSRGATRGSATAARAAAREERATGGRTKQVVSVAETEAWQDIVDELETELCGLQQQLYETESRCAQIEGSVREEVIEEMMEQMREMEYSFTVRMENERVTTEEKFQRKLEIIVKESLRRHRAEQDDDVADAAQLEYYKRRVDELQRDHKAVLQRLLQQQGGGKAKEESESKGEEKTEGGVGEVEMRSDLRATVEGLSAQLAGVEREAVGLREANDRLRDQVTSAHLREAQRSKLAEETIASLRAQLTESDDASSDLLLLEMDLDQARKERDSASREADRLRVEVSTLSARNVALHTREKDLEALVNATTRTTGTTAGTSAAGRSGAGGGEATSEVEVSMSEAMVVAEPVEEVEVTQATKPTPLAPTHQTNIPTDNTDTIPTAKEVAKDTVAKDTVAKDTKPRRKSTRGRPAKETYVAALCVGGVMRSRAVEVAKENVEATPADTGKRKRRLYNANTPSHLAHDAVGDVGPTKGPIARRLRSRNSAAADDPMTAHC